MSKASSSERLWIEKAAEVVKEKTAELWNNIPKVGVGHAGAMWRQGLKEVRAVFFPESNVAQPVEIGVFGTATQSEVTAERRVAAAPALPNPGDPPKSEPLPVGPVIAAGSPTPPAGPEPKTTVTHNAPDTTPSSSPSPSPVATPSQPALVEPLAIRIDDRLDRAAVQLEASRTSPNNPTVHGPDLNAPEIERE